MKRPVWRAIVAAFALAAIALSLSTLRAATNGLTITSSRAGLTPVTVFRPASGESAPVVVIAHGFAGSQQLMQPFAVTLARNGYIAVTFDFPGHGRNPAPLPGGIADDKAASTALLASLRQVVDYARGLPGVDGKVALLGHSMASDIVIRDAQSHDDIAATVAISVFSPTVARDRPRDLMVIVGALEPGVLQNEGLRVVGMASPEPARERVTYGDLAAGTARRLVLARGVEHISVLYSGDALRETVGWLNGVFGRDATGFIDARGKWLGLLLVGLVGLGWPLAGFLPAISARPLGADVPWRRLLPIALIPAVATPLLLWKAPTDFLPLIVGDYLAVHFAVYGLLTAAGLWLIRGRERDDDGPTVSMAALGIAAGSIAAYSVVAIGLCIDAFATSFMPVPPRLPLIPAMFAGILPWFAADEWLTRGGHARPGAYIVTKVCFLLSLAGAIALNLHRLFFLIIIVPVILLLFVIYGLFSRWAYRATNHPLAGAIANAVALAWTIGVIFPMVTR